MPYPVSTGTVIEASDFNNFRNLVDDVVGTSLSGYGLSGLLERPVYNNWRIHNVPWSNLVRGLNLVYKHQTGSDLEWDGTKVINISLGPNIDNGLRTGTLIASSLTNFLYSSAQVVGSVPGRYQATSTEVAVKVVENGISKRVSVWSGPGSISHSVRVSWLTTETAQYFFNLGGSIELESSHDNNSSGSEDEILKTVIANVGTLVYNRNDYVSSSSIKVYTPVIYSSGGVQGQYSVIAARDNSNRSITFDINFGIDPPVAGDLVVVPNQAQWVLGAVDPTSFVVINPLSAAGTYSDQTVGSNSIFLNVLSNGGLVIVSSGGGANVNSSWGSPIVDGAGAGYWVKFTLNSSSGENTRSTAPSTGWLSLSSDQSVSLTTNALGQAGNSRQQSQYLVEISSSSSGSPIVSSGVFTLTSLAIPNLFTPANPLPGSGNSYSELEFGQISVELLFDSNGSFLARSLISRQSGIIVNEFERGLWGVPSTANAGANYWARVTLNSQTASGTGVSSYTETTGLIRLDSQLRVFVSAAGNDQGRQVQEAAYTIEIYADSGGLNLVASGTYNLRAESEPVIISGGGAPVFFGGSNFILPDFDNENPFPEFGVNPN